MNGYPFGPGKTAWARPADVGAASHSAAQAIRHLRRHLYKDLVRSGPRSPLRKATVNAYRWLKSQTDEVLPNGWLKEEPK